MIKWSFNELVEVDSTQEVLRRLAEAGADEGTVVVSRRQTAGRGRHGRNWASPEGGLYMSVLLRPPPSSNLRTLTLAASLAVVKGIKAATGLGALVRWPNDIMIGGKKAAGVLAESSFAAQNLSFVTVGIGVNCNSKVVPEDSSNQVTSLAEQAGKQTDIMRLRQAILDSFAVIYKKWLSGDDIVDEARGTIGTVGKRVVVSTKSGEELTGLASGIEPTGDLALEISGKKRVLHAEDVTLLREA